MYVVNEEVVGDEINTPLRELLAAQRGWTAYQDGEDEPVARELAAIEAQRHTGVPTEKQITDSGDLLNTFLAALLPNPTEKDGNCSKPLMVDLGGFEPPTFSLRTRRATNCAIGP